VVSSRITNAGAIAIPGETLMPRKVLIRAHGMGFAAAV
jgi:hypothetical protein